MKKAPTGVLIIVVLALIFLLSAWANFVNLLLHPDILHIGARPGTMETSRSDSVGVTFNKAGSYCDLTNMNGVTLTAIRSGDANLKNLTDISWSRNSLTRRMLITESIDAGETRIYLTPATEFGTVKKVLDPGTMLLLGSGLLGLGLFAIKFRK